jgi:transcriptional regulator with XRE-family HTH domain
MVTLLPYHFPTICRQTQSLSVIIYPSMNMSGRPTNRRRPAFGTRMAAIRHERGISQQSLAKKLNVNRSLIRYYERDTLDPKMSVVLRCAKALKVPIEILIGRNCAAAQRMDPSVSRLVQALMTMDPKRRGFALRLFSRQLTEIKRRAANYENC